MRPRALLPAEPLCLRPASRCAMVRTTTTLNPSVSLDDLRAGVRLPRLPPFFVLRLSPRRPNKDSRP